MARKIGNIEKHNNCWSFASDISITSERERKWNLMNYHRKRGIKIGLLDKKWMSSLNRYNFCPWLESHYPQSTSLRWVLSIGTLSFNFRVFGVSRLKIELMIFQSGEDSTTRPFLYAQDKLCNYPFYSAEKLRRIIRTVCCVVSIQNSSNPISLLVRYKSNYDEAITFQH